MDNKIKVSVVIPTRNRGFEIELCIQALINQTFPKKDFEIVVVDDGSNDYILKRLLPYKKKNNLTIVQTSRKDSLFRIAFAKNFGAQYARGEILIFIDSDIIADPFLLEEHIKNYKKEKNISVVGCRFHLRREFHHILRGLIRREKFKEIANLPLAIDLREKGAKYFRLKTLSEFPAPWMFYYANNVSIPKDIFEDAGGFDCNFKGWGGEDLELGYRLWKNGTKLIQNQNAVGVHLVHSIDNKTRIDSLSKNKNRFLLKHPDINVELFNDFLNDPEKLVSEIKFFDKIKKSLFLGNPRQIHKAKVAEKAKIILLGAGKEVSLNRKANVVVDLRTKYLANYKGKVKKLNLIGYNLPFAENSFNLMVINNYLNLFSEYHIFRIIAEAVRLSKRVIIFESKKNLPMIAEICKSFSSGQVKISYCRKIVRIEKGRSRKNRRSIIVAFVLAFLADYIATGTRLKKGSYLLRNLKRKIQRRERLFKMLDQRVFFSLVTRTEPFREAWEKVFFDFKKKAGRIWQWFRRPERISEENGVHLYLDEENIFWLPGINVKWFIHSADPFLKLSKNDLERYAFFIDANIYSNCRLQALAEKHGLQKKAMYKIAGSFSKTDHLVAFLKTVKPVPEHLNIRNCYYFLESENFEKAEHYLKRIKNKAYYRAFLTILQIETEEFGKALKTFRRLENKVQGLPSFILSNLYAKVGIAHYEFGKTSIAFKFWEKALSQNSENLLAKTSLAFKKILK